MRKNQTPETAPLFEVASDVQLDLFAGETAEAGQVPVLACRLRR